jgi:hypothetical protein
MEKSYFKVVTDSEIQQIKLKKETWIACVLVCQPVVAEREPFRDLPRKLPWDRTFKLAEQNRKLHT